MLNVQKQYIHGMEATARREEEDQGKSRLRQPRRENDIRTALGHDGMRFPYGELKGLKCSGFSLPVNGKTVEDLKQFRDHGIDFVGLDLSRLVRQSCSKKIGDNHAITSFDQGPPLLT